ncbi:hypothetical protein [Nocardioides sp. Soil805]|uniref:hypothetical protein n=1 Tax=Nocardioides sp. Soil805 TaxID=1736416 RepID=UPI000702B1D5|nr:hypothetical protein [Nocardioides sp. Soil805]KRF36115.1 hypothetical protein ASG94_01095 [Nocardioides sp. Soil805]
MMAFPRHGFVLLAMPKCASTSLEAALAPYAELVVDRPPGLKHVGASGFTRRIAPRLAADGYERDSYELVTMFRDPVRWLESWWRYRARPASVRHRPGADSSALSFDEFARLYVAGDRDAPTPRGRPGQFLTIDDVVEVDRVLSVERPDAWEPWFSARIGMPVEFGRRNVSPPADPELAGSTRAALVDFFAPEYDVWARLQETGSWSGARGTRLVVPPRAG